MAVRNRSVSNNERTARDLIYPSSWPSADRIAVSHWFATSLCLVRQPRCQADATEGRVAVRLCPHSLAASTSSLPRWAGIAAERPLIPFSPSDPPHFGAPAIDSGRVIAPVAAATTQHERDRVVSYLSLVHANRPSLRPWRRASRRSRCSARARVGPMLPIGIPSAALISV